VIPLAQKVELLHASLERAHIEHAFGGALALAYCTNDPRATADIDINVFVRPEKARDVFASLPNGIAATDLEAEVALDRGQVRLRWEETPIDLFFAYHAFHDTAASRTRVVPFGSSHIPVLACSDLVVFKALFGRPRDWVDIAAVVAAGTVDVVEPLAHLEELVGRSGDAYQRLRTLDAGEAETDGAERYRRAFGSPREET